MRRTIAIVGGGVAGLAAALRVAEAGDRPIVIETRKRLGGRATSFTDPRSGRTLDNCQHVLMGCCTNLLDLYERLGVLDRIEWHDTTFWANPPREPDRLRTGRWLPAPLHFTRSGLSMRLLSWSERLALLRANVALLRMGLAGRERWRGRTFGEFLDATRQPPRVRELFWEPVVVSACNLPSDRCEAAYAIQVFQEGFLGNPFSPVMGLSTVPLVELYDRAEAIVAEAGGEIRLGVSAKALAFDGASAGGRVTGVVTDEGFVEAAATISAVPADRLDRLASDTLKAADHRLRQLDRIRPSPIIGVHLFFAERVLDTPHLVLPGRATQWFFAKGTVDGLHHVHAVISGADGWLALPEDEIVRRTVADLHWASPRSRGLEPVEARSVKEVRATFAVEPGIDAFRPQAAPDARGGVRNLFLAGDWTATGWPATMEGACRSGYRAAQACTGKGGIVADIPVAPLARWLGLR